jgi:LysR family transcriptional activator of glutamate synthase operon
VVDLQISTVRPTDPTVQRRELLVEPLRLAVPSVHPLGRRAWIHLAEVSSEPFVMLRPTSLLRQLCEDLCDGAGFRPTLGLRETTCQPYEVSWLRVSVSPSCRLAARDRPMP